MTSVFEYDVFLSFASSDEAFVKPIWQELCLSGLRVFWSDAVLRNELGNSWFDIIESSLERSRHMLLIWSPASMNSIWVKREYRAFHDHCYKPGVRRLIPALAQGSKISDLPLFLRELEVGQLSKDNFLPQLVSTLGGINIEELRTENQTLKQNLESLRRDKHSLEETIKELKARLAKQLKEKESIPSTPERTAPKLSVENLKGSNQSPSPSEKQKALELLGLSPETSSREISQKYKSLEKEYKAILDQCPKALKEICWSRLVEIKNAYDLVFRERKKEEDEAIKQAFELFQLSAETPEKQIFKRYRQLKTACLKAMESSDKFIKEAAAEELRKLEAAFLNIFPKGFSEVLDTEQAGLIKVVMPWMGYARNEVTIAKWLKKEGETVEKNEILFIVRTDKFDVNITSPATGILKNILVDEQETAAIDTVIAQIEEISNPIEHRHEANTQIDDRATDRDLIRYRGRQ